MTVHALWVISKAGGLVFSRSYSDALPPLPVNTILTLAGILHGIHAITAKLTPSPIPGQPVGGLESFEAEGWGGKVFLTATGMFGHLQWTYSGAIRPLVVGGGELRTTTVIENNMAADLR
nr:uncharacterized protein CI109_002776 [Kwoniella shandongensis]KAA5529018.1 hypothetical protein CI109_002776 [Kwoniella shandongensis]